MPPRSISVSTAPEDFPDALHSVDIFHAKGHLFEVAKAIYGPNRARKRREELDKSRVGEIIAALNRHADTREEARKNAESFSTNRERMSYPKLRAMGLWPAASSRAAASTSSAPVSGRAGCAGAPTAPTPSSH